MKDVFVIGGPNGADKTTAANDLLPNKLALLEFINADEIARGHIRSCSRRIRRWQDHA